MQDNKLNDINHIYSPICTNRSETQDTDFAPIIVNVETDHSYSGPSECSEGQGDHQGDKNFPSERDIHSESKNLIDTLTEYQVIPVISIDSRLDKEDSVNATKLDDNRIFSIVNKISLVDILDKYKGALLLPYFVSRSPDTSEDSIRKFLLQKSLNSVDPAAVPFSLRNNNFILGHHTENICSPHSLSIIRELEKRAEVEGIERTLGFDFRGRSSEENNTEGDSDDYDQELLLRSQRSQEKGQTEVKKKVRFSITNMESDTNFRVTLSIKNEANGQTVFYKVDKKRFRRDKTIKLMVNSFYRVDISFKPTQTLARALIDGQEVKTIERVHDSTASAYSLYLPTITMTPSRKGHRDELVLIIQLKNGLLLQLSLQVKLYKAGDCQHCEWGSTFHCVEYDCEVYTEAGIVTVLKETFR